MKKNEMLTFKRACNFIFEKIGMTNTEQIIGVLSEDKDCITSICQGVYDYAQNGNHVPGHVAFQGGGCSIGCDLGSCLAAKCIELKERVTCPPIKS